MRNVPVRKPEPNLPYALAAAGVLDCQDLRSLSGRRLTRRWPNQLFRPARPGPLPTRTVCAQIGDVEAAQGSKNHAQEGDARRIVRRVRGWCRVRAGELRDQGCREGRKGTRWSCENVVHEEVHGRSVRYKAVSSDGKPLSGAAKTSFMKKCEKGA